MMFWMAWEWEMMSMSQEYLMLQYLYHSNFHRSLTVSDKVFHRQDVQSEKDFHEQQFKSKDILLPQPQNQLHSSQQHQEITVMEQVEPLDLRKPDNRKLWNPATLKNFQSKFEECQCQICGKTFSRPWLLKGKL